MNEEALKIRQEIEKLKRRLREISKGSLKGEEEIFTCSSSFCSHDEILDTLRAWCKQMGSKSRCVIAGFEDGGGEKNFCWYSTTISPEKVLYKELNDKNSMVQFYKEFIDVNILNILEFLSYGKNEATIEELCYELNSSYKNLKDKIDLLLKYKFIEKEGSILKVTNIGWQFYCVMGHIYYNNVVKPPLEKMIYIDKVLSESFKLSIGQEIFGSVDDLIDKIKSSSVINGISKEKISLEEMKRILLNFYRFSRE